MAIADRPNARHWEDVVGFLDRTLAQSSLGLCYFGPDRIIRWANGVFAEMVAVPLDRLIGLPGDQAMSGWTEQIGQLYDQVRDTGQSRHGRAHPYLFPQQPERGTAYWDHCITAVRDPEGDFAGWLLTANEVTEQVRAAQRLAEAAQREQVVEALQHERELLQRIIDTIPVMITIYDPSLNSFRFNRECRQLLGWSEEDAATGDFMEKAYPDPRYREMVSRYMQSLESGWRSLEVTARDGSVVESSWANVRLSDDTQVGIGIDIRQRKQAEAERERLVAEAEAGQQLLQALMEHVPEGITIAEGADARIRLVSRYGQELLGGPHQDRTAGEVAARWTVYEADGVTPMAEADLPLVRALRQGETVRDRDVIQVNEQGRRLWLSCNAAPISSSRGDIIGGIVAWRDITERKRAEAEREQLLAEVQDSEQRFRSLFENSMDAVLLTAPDGRVFSVNPAATRMFGYSEDEFRRLGRAAVKVESDPRTPAALEQRARTGKTLAEMSMRRADGTVFEAEVSSAIFHDSSGEARTAMFIRDITDRKSAEAALRESEERFRKVFEGGPLGMALVGPDYRIQRANHTFLRLLGYAEEELLALTFPDITYAEDLDKDLSLAQQLFRGEIPSFQMEKRYVRKNGERIWGRLTASLIRDREGMPVYAIGMIEDITERRRAEAEREQLLAEIRAANQELSAAGLRNLQLAEQYGRQVEQMNALLRNLGEGVTMFDGQGRVILSNPGGKPPDIGNDISRPRRPV